MLVKSRHDLDKVTWPVPVVELQGQDFIPRILASTGTARQCKEIRTARDPPVARDWIALVPILFMETIVKTVPNASISFS